MLLICWLKSSLSLLSIPKKFNFRYCINLNLIEIYNLVSIISFAFTGDCCLKFTWIDNRMVIFKPIYCYFTFWFENTNYIFHFFSKTWNSITICKIMSWSNQYSLKRVIEKDIKQSRTYNLSLLDSWYYLFETAFNIFYTDTMFSTFQACVNVAYHIFVKLISSYFDNYEMMRGTIESLWKVHKSSSSRVISFYVSSPFFSKSYKYILHEVKFSIL